MIRTASPLAAALTGALTGLVTLAALPAAAQQTGYSISGDIGAGVQVAPDYLGSDEADTAPWLVLRDFRLVKPGETAETAHGFSIAPTWDYRGGRSSDDNDALAGLDDIDPTIELGAGLHYYAGPTTVYLDLRKGFGGQDGVVGELGAKYRFDVNARTKVTALLEAKYGSDQFTRTYFGVTTEESRDSGLAAYRPSGGFYAASAGLAARYEITPNWALLGELRYTQLIGDAADSPIVKEKAQPSIRVGIVRHFDLRF